MTSHRASRAPAGRRLFWTCVGSMCALFAGCNRDTCAGLHPPSLSADSPRIVEVAIANQDVINPWQFNLGITFTDNDGDLGSGLLDVYVGTSEPVALPLANYFATSSIDLDSRAGRIGVDLNVSSTSVQDDSLLRLGFQLRDNLLNYSNCYTLDMHFDVDKLGWSAPSRALRVPCGTRVAMRGAP